HRMGAYMECGIYPAHQHAIMVPVLGDRGVAIGGSERIIATESERVWFRCAVVNGECVVIAATGSTGTLCPCHITIGLDLGDHRIRSAERDQLCSKEVDRIVEASRHVGVPLVVRRYRPSDVTIRRSCTLSPAVGTILPKAEQKKIIVVW